VGIDILADLAQRYLGEPFELYDTEPVVETRTLGVVAPTYTLCVDDPGHRFDSEGIISKNTAREIMLVIEGRIWRRLPRAAKPIFDEHDALGIMCPQSMTADVLACVREEGIYTLDGPAGSIPILMDEKVEKSWLGVK
jgi:hypothetical protein